MDKVSSQGNKQHLKGELYIWQRLLNGALLIDACFFDKIVEVFRGKATGLRVLMPPLHKKEKCEKHSALP